MIPYVFLNYKPLRILLEFKKKKTILCGQVTLHFNLQAPLTHKFMATKTTIICRYLNLDFTLLLSQLSLG